MDILGTAAAIAHPNIAFIKYWGNADRELRIPRNGSISMNLGGLETRTQVTFSAGLTADQFFLNQQQIRGRGLERVSSFLDRVRSFAKMDSYALVESENNFPTGAGIASSASAFSALSLAASRAAGLDLEEKALSRLARFGSGSASRSVPAGFVEWYAGSSDLSSYAESVADPDFWNLVDLVVVLSRHHKSIGSTSGHALAETSPLQEARVRDAERRLDLCRRAILNRDFDAFTGVVEQDCHLMHAVMLTSHPPLVYWEPATIALIKAVQAWRKDGTRVCYTIDAGPNVHIICPEDEMDQVKKRLNTLSGIREVLECFPGGGASLLDENRPAV